MTDNLAKEPSLTPRALAAHIAQQLIVGQARHWEVSAVPGAGKTEALAQLVRELVSRGEDPATIRALSFANSSVDELHDRLTLVSNEKGLGKKVRSAMRAVETQTMHSLALNALPEGDTRLLLGDDAFDFFSEALEKLRLQSASMANTPGEKQLLSALEILCSDDQLRGAALRIIDYARTAKKKPAAAATDLGIELPSDVMAVLSRIRDRYVASLGKSGSADFTQLLRSAVATGKLPKLRFVLVDEYQDCAAAQRDVLKVLAELRASIVVVGDANQALYGFSGAHSRPLAEYLSEVETTNLDASARLTRQTARFASSLPGLRPHNIRTTREGPEPTLTISGTYWECLEAVAEHVKYLLSSGVDPAQIAILARTNQLLKDHEDHLLRLHRIGASRVGHASESSAVETVLRLVNLARKCARTQQAPCVGAIEDAWRCEPVPEAEMLAAGVSKLRLAARRSCDGPSIEAQYRLCADAYMSIVGRSRDTASARNAINQWQPLACSFARPQDLHRAIADVSERPICTSTIHRAKGRQWEHVLLVGVTDGLLPIYFAKSGAAIQQEINALYVACTRARHELRLFHAPRPHARSRQPFDTVSRLIPPRFADTSVSAHPSELA